MVASSGKAHCLCRISKMYAQYLIQKLELSLNMGNGSIRGSFRGGVPDHESGSHTQGCVLTQKRPVLRRCVHKATNIYIAVCKCKCAVPS